MGRRFRGLSGSSGTGLELVPSLRRPVRNGDSPLMRLRLTRRDESGLSSPSTKNQQLTRPFSRESPYEARLSRRDENGWEVRTAVPSLRDWAGLCHCDDASAQWGQTSFPGTPTRTVQPRINNLREAFSRESPMRPCLARRDENWVGGLDGCAVLRGLGRACAIGTPPGAQWGQTSFRGAPAGTVQR